MRRAKINGRRVANGKAAERPTVADPLMVGYLCFPTEESGYDLQGTPPAVHAWLGRVAGHPGWRAAYVLLPGKRLRCYV